MNRGVGTRTQEAFGSVSSEAAREATGRDWDEWLQVLDAAGADRRDHKGIVALLAREHPDVSSWWQQSIAVGYERARGKRAVGQTADAGFQVGVQRSVTASVARVWDELVARPGLWLGEGASVVFEPGAHYEVPATGGRSAAGGQMRVVKPGERLRMTWRPEEWPAAATLQLTLSRSSSGKTVIQVNLEKLPDADAREVMRARWREALGRLAAAVS